MFNELFIRLVLPEIDSLKSSHLLKDSLLFKEPTQLPIPMPQPNETLKPIYHLFLKQQIANQY